MGAQAIALLEEKWSSTLSMSVEKNKKREAPLLDLVMADRSMLDEIL